MKIFLILILLSVTLNAQPELIALMGDDISYNNEETTTYQANVIANGGTVSSAALSALDAFVTGVKADGDWDLIVEFDPYAGNNLKACLVKLKYPTGVISACINMDGNFTDTQYAENTGLTSADANSEMRLNTGFVPSDVADVTQNSTTLGLAINSEKAEAVTQIGAQTASLGGRLTARFWYDTNLSNVQLNRSASSNITTSGATGSKGYWFSSRKLSTNIDIFWNGDSVGTVAAASQGQLDDTVQVHNYQLTGTDAICSTQTIAGYMICKGLTEAQAARITARWEAFNEALGRNLIPQ